MFTELKEKFNEKRVLIMGLGLHGGGIATTKFFHSLGAKLTITDIKTKSQLSQSLEKIKNLKGIKFTLGKHDSQDFKNQDFILRNPDVPLDSPYLKTARKKKIPVITDIGIFLSYFKGKIIGITGTKGKSTTSSLISQVLKKKFKNVYLLGNIREPIFTHFSKISNKDIAIIELSSFQLEAEDVAKSPQIAIITNIFKDHLNHHKTFKEYIKAKEKIFKFQKSTDWLIINSEDKILKAMAKKSKSRIFDAAEKSFAQITIKKLKILASYKIYKNQFLNALSIAKIFKIPHKAVIKVLKNFKPLEGRLEKVAEIKGVKFINDTTATNPDATIFALRNLGAQNKLILIAGGMDKNLNYKEMAKSIQYKTKALILLPGSASDKIKKELKTVNSKWLIPAPARLKRTVRDAAVNSKFIKVDTMEEAVRKAYSMAKPGDTVLLSPGAASFNLFKHEFDRGKKFVENIKLLANKKF